MGRTKRGIRCSLVSSIVELEHISIRQLQHIRTNYLSSLELTGRTDRMNCYIWDGAEWSAQICQHYYNMHIRPLEAELLVARKEVGFFAGHSVRTLAVGDGSGSGNGPKAMAEGRQGRKPVSGP